MSTKDVVEFVAYSARNVSIAALAQGAMALLWCLATHDTSVGNYYLTMQYVGGVAVLIGCASVFGNTTSGSITAHQQVYMGLAYDRDNRDIERSIAFSWLMMISGGLVAALGIVLRNM